jgi:hypothetical protein
LIIIGVAVSCSGGNAGKPAAGRPPTTATPTPSAVAGTCQPANLRVTAATDATTYPAGTLPHLSVTIRNAGSTRCVFADSPSSRSWSIFSGADEVYTTRGCAVSHRVTYRTLAPGKAVRHTLVWDRHRDGTGCTSGSTAGPGTYRLYVNVGRLRTSAAIFHLSG